jgi:hypothetical protein
MEVSLMLFSSFVAGVGQDAASIVIRGVVGPLRVLFISPLVRSSSSAQGMCIVATENRLV